MAPYSPILTSAHGHAGLRWSGARMGILSQLLLGGTDYV
jgi:hypothetical protein